MQINAPDRFQRFIDLENFTASFTNQNGRLINENGLIVIPVVVHILHRGEPEGTGLNISMAQIQSQIDVLNQDFRRLNSDRINTPPILWRGPVTFPLNLDLHALIQTEIQLMAW